STSSWWTPMLLAPAAYCQTSKMDRLLSKAETLDMFNAARRSGVFLAEAYPYRAQEQTLALRRLLDEGAIGRVQTIFACFDVKFSEPSNIRLDPDRGGGALLDAGSYATNMVRMVAGEKPTRVNAIARWSATKVDLTVIANLEFSSGLLGQIACSFNTAYHRHALIAGTEGILETTFLNSPPDAGPPEIHLRRGVPSTTPRETIALPGGNGFLAEAESYARAVALGHEHWNGSTEAESIDTVATLEAIARSIHSGNWESV
ncbi:Gfo/Idh/MocA family oxidoreductase, partial [Paraburkholderia sp. SIMBA_049]